MRPRLQRELRRIWGNQTRCKRRWWSVSERFSSALHRFPSDPPKLNQTGLHSLVEISLWNLLKTFPMNSDSTHCPLFHWVTFPSCYGRTHVNPLLSRQQHDHWVPSMMANNWGERQPVQSQMWDTCHQFLILSQLVLLCLMLEKHFSWQFATLTLRNQAALFWNLIGRFANKRNRQMIRWSHLPTTASFTLH